MMFSKIIVFTRYPSPGKTKTRLIPLLGAKGAATLQARLTEQVVAMVKHFSVSCSVPMEIRYNGGSTVLMSQWLGRHLVYRRQKGVGLGVKMRRTFEESFDEGFARVILVGTDVVGMSVPILETSLYLLDDHDLVHWPCKRRRVLPLGTSGSTTGAFSGYLMGLR